jgi:hypothetical protein
VLSGLRVQVEGSDPIKATELVLSTSETEVPVSNEVSKAGEFPCGRLGPQAIDEVESAALTMEKLAPASLRGHGRPAWSKHLAKELGGKRGGPAYGPLR